MTDGGNRLTVSRITAEEASAQLVAELLDMYRAVQEAVAGTDNDPLWVIGTHPAASQLKSAAESEALFVARIDDRIAGALIADRTPAPGYEDVAWQVEAAAEEAAVVHLFALHPDFRGRHLARPFLGAQRTYEALGFANLGRACLNYGPGPYAANPAGGFVIFEKEL